MKKYFKVLFIVSFILFIILFSSLVHIFNKGFYSDKFEENGAYATFGKDEVDNVNSEVFGYFLFKNNLETDFFNEKEKEHLRDVRILFLIGYILLFASFLALIIFIYFFKNSLDKLFLLSGLSGLLLLLILILLTFLDYNFLFTLFHEVFFEENSWIFGVGENIVNIYTYNLFYDIFLRIIATVFSLFLLISLICLIKNRLKY
ncbi:DUF1461 domain-containing protein [Candidatus Woesearchaeota archaeon]|nr:DUF1461 domain-containing protein [Candidatus Woesearchaeota archaeon]